MGFLNKKPIMKTEGFHPIDLNEDNVQAIFERCLITEQTTDTIGTSIMDVELGLLNKHIPVLFDKKKIGQEKKAIQYLYGQLLCRHQEKNSISLNEVFQKYNGETWTESNGTVLKFLHLGSATTSIMPFDCQSKAAPLPFLYPATLSPKDPAFPAWWEEHKAEWED